MCYREIPPNKTTELIVRLKLVDWLCPYTAHLPLSVRSNIQYDEHRDYPVSYIKPPFAFEEPLFRRPFSNISAHFPSELL